MPAWNRNFRDTFSAKRKNTKVCYDDGVRANLFQFIQIQFEIFKFILPGHNVQRYVDFFSEFMGIFNRILHLIERKIICRRTHTELGTGQIDRIGAKTESRLQLFKVPCRR